MSADDERLVVRVPTELPTLNRQVSRILLEILVNLTKVEVLDGPLEGGASDC
jgi:hypothetical protein